MRAADLVSLATVSDTSATCGRDQERLQNYHPSRLDGSQCPLTSILLWTSNDPSNEWPPRLALPSPGVVTHGAAADHSRPLGVVAAALFLSASHA